MPALLLKPLTSPQPAAVDAKVLPGCVPVGRGREAAHYLDLPRPQRQPDVRGAQLGDPRGFRVG